MYRWHTRWISTSLASATRVRSRRFNLEGKEKVPKVRQSLKSGGREGLEGVEIGMPRVLQHCWKRISGAFGTKKKKTRVREKAQ